MITAEQYKEANLIGLKHRGSGNLWSYYTPTLQIAYNLGLNGVNIQDVKNIVAFRYGKAPDNFISYNYSENKAENGLSVYTNMSIIRSEFLDRDVYTYEGLPVSKGGDGEILILAFDAENYD